MSLTEDELTVVNQATDRASLGQIAYATQTTLPALTAIRHYEQTRNSLLESFEWPFATDREELGKISTIVLDAEPGPANWAVGDVITGVSSGTTAEILTVTAGAIYEIIHISGDFTDGERITNATVYDVTWEGVSVEYEDETVCWYDDSDADQVTCGTGYPDVDEITPDFEWTHQYHLPNDFLRLKKIYEDDGTDQVDNRWEREGQRILTNYDTCNIKYIKKITDPDDFDPLFTEVLILRTALKLVPPLAGAKTNPIKADIKEDLRVAETKARLVAAQETNVSGRQDWDLARYGN
jgi:hypothetical protein